MTAGSLSLAIVLVLAACFGGEAQDRLPEDSGMGAPPAVDVDPSGVGGPTSNDAAGSGESAGSTPTVEASGSEIPGNSMRGDEAARDDASTEVEIEGVRVRYVSLPVARGRSPRRDLQAIGQATAELSIDRPVMFGRDRMTRGRYPLAIESEKGEALVLVIGEPDTDQGPSSAGEADRDSRVRAQEAATPKVESGRRGTARDDARKEANAVRSPAREAEEQDDAAGGAPPPGHVKKAKSPAPASHGAGGPAQASHGAGGPAQVESPAKSERRPLKDPSGPSSPGSAKGLRLSLEIVPREMRTQHVRFDLETARKGKGFRISIHAGSTVARTPVIALEQP